jgi:hypothetical protein
MWRRSITAQRFDRTLQLKTQDHSQTVAPTKLSFSPFGAGLR